MTNIITQIDVNWIILHLYFKNRTCQVGQIFDQVGQEWFNFFWPSKALNLSLNVYFMHKPYKNNTCQIFDQVGQQWFNFFGHLKL